MKKFLFLLMMMLSISFKSQQWKWYVNSNSGQPWGSVSNITAMNTAFGAAWSQGTFQGTAVNAVFSPSVCLVYLDGGDANACALNNYIIANLTAIQNWVFNGGRLFINAAPNQCGNMNWGFGGVTLNYATGPYSPNGYASTIPPHPIFTGPAVITTTNHTGNWYCHGYVSGPGLTPIISNTVVAWSGTQPPMPRIILGSLPWGAGLCLFGSMTNTSFHTPNPSATNLRANMLSWLYVCCTQPTITVASSNSVICSGQNATVTGSGAGIGGTYTINPGGLIGPSVSVSPSVTTIYTVAGTNSANCVGSQTYQILVNPTPSLTPQATPSLACRNSSIQLSVNTPSGNTVTWNWQGPGFTSTFQNPIIAQAQSSNTGIFTVQAIAQFSNGTCSSSKTLAITVINTNTVTVGTTTVCQGSPINLTSTVSGQSGLIWQGPNSFTSSLQNPTINPSFPINSGNYTLTAQFTVQNSTLICLSNAVSNVSVVATSPVTLSLPSNACQGQTVTLTASAAPSPNWILQGPLGMVSLTPSLVLSGVNPQMTGQYTATAVWSIGSVTCPITNWANLSVVGVNPITVNSPSTICYGENIQLTAQSPSAVAWTWSASSGYQSNIQNPLFSQPQPSISGIYTVTAAFTNSQLTCFNSATTSVLVNPILTFTLPPYQLFCWGYDIITTGPSGATSYTWQGPNFQSNLQNLQINSIQPTSAGFYTLMVNLGPCTTSAQTQIDVTTPISFGGVTWSKEICAGETVTLQAPIKGGSGVWAWNWSPTTYLSSNTGSTQVLTPDGSVIYNLSVWDVACPLTKIWGVVNVKVNVAPTPSFNLINSCEPICYNLKMNGVRDVIWSFGNKNFGQGDICLTAGTYSAWATVTGLNGCVGKFGWEGNPLTVYPKPGGDFTWSPDKPNNISENKVSFWPTAKNSKTPIFLWNFSGGKDFTGSSKGPIRQYDEVGKYPVLLVTESEWGCKDTTLKIIEIEEDYTFYIPDAFSPNGIGPNNTFHPVVTGAIDYTLAIFDRWGQCILNGVKNGEWDGTYKGILCKNEVYIWKVTVRKPKGETKEYVGHVTLLK